MHLIYHINMYMVLTTAKGRVPWKLCNFQRKKKYTKRRSIRHCSSYFIQPWGDLKL